MAILEKTCNCATNANNDSQIQRYFKFLPEDVDKFIVIKLMYEEHMFIHTQLVINGHKLSPNDNLYFYGVYKIEWYSEWLKKDNNMGYKIKLTPVGEITWLGVLIVLGTLLIWKVTSIITIIYLRKLLCSTLLKKHIILLATKISNFIQNQNNY